MKKMIIIISILSLIFIGMIIYKNNSLSTNITINEVNQIEEYITKIYSYKEITGQALPVFDDINNADDKWTWEIVKKNLEEYELEYESIQNKAKEVFGENFVKEYPKQGTNFIKYNEQTKKYVATEENFDEKEDLFFLNNIQKTKNGYIAEIIEYLEDYTDYEEDKIYIKNIQEDMITTLTSQEIEDKTIDIVKNNIDKFSRKTITLIKDKQGNIFIKKVEY